MATSSFTKNFVVTDQNSIRQLKADIKKSRKILIKKYDLKAESEKGIQLLTQRLSK